MYSVQSDLSFSEKQVINQRNERETVTTNSAQCNLYLVNFLETIKQITREIKEELEPQIQPDEELKPKGQLRVY